MNILGLNSPEVQELVTQADMRSDRKYFYLQETEAMDGHLSLRYALDKGVSMRHLELHYSPTDSNLHFTARTNQVLVNYHLEFR